MNDQPGDGWGEGSCNADAPPFTKQFGPLDPGTYRVEALGTPFRREPVGCAARADVAGRTS